MSNAWHNWTSPTPRPDVSHGWRRYEWFTRHDHRYIHPAQQNLHWDGYPYGDTGAPANSAPYARQEVWAQLKQDLQPHANTRLLPGLSHILWEHRFEDETPIAFAVHRPDGSVEEGVIRRDGAPVQASGPLPDGSAIVVGDAFTVRVRGERLGFGVFVHGGEANLRLAPRSASDVVPRDTRYNWTFETVHAPVDRPMQPSADWLRVTRGTLRDMWVGPTVEAEGHAAALRLFAQPLPVNSTPIVVQGVNSNWTCGLYEPATGDYRPIGSEGDVAYAQVAASRRDLDVVIGNVVTCSAPEVRITAVQETDREGKATGRWLVHANNPTERELAVTFTVPDAFNLIRTRQFEATIPAGGLIERTIE